MPEPTAGYFSRVQRLLPFLSWWPLVNPASLRADAQSGLTNAIVVLPQGVAYALIAGLPPEYGLYAAIIPAVIAALFGSSWHLISGPTAAMSVVVFTSVSPLAEPGTAAFIALALTLTLMKGVFQLMLALARLGVLVNFVSQSVVIGFTAGAAVVIASSQLPALFGIAIEKNGGVTGTWWQLLHHLGEVNYYSLSVALFTVAVCVTVKRWRPRWPNMLIALALASVLAIIIDPHHSHIALVGAIPSGLPPLSLPDFSLASISALAPGALAISLLGLVEAAAISRAIASRSHQRLDDNQEFVGQGLSNIVGAFFSCYASSGSFSRSGINYTSGARTPMAAIFASGFLLLIVLLIPGITTWLPRPAMAGLLLVVAWNLIDFHHIRLIISGSRSETTVLIATFAATLLVELEFAIYTGVILSLVFYLKRTSTPRVVSILPDPDSKHPLFVNAERRRLPYCPQLRVIRIEGSLFFGAVNHVQEYLQTIREPRLLIVGNGINFVDMVGADMLVQEAERRRELGGNLYLCNLREGVLRFLLRNHRLDDIRRDHVFINKGQAIHRIYDQLDAEVCRTCTARIFRECHIRPPGQHAAVKENG
ncbi:SulP family inorganic anion transporter [Oceanimonas baumannii]|uniref:Sodium-independent anion transporter n=1 Tax=Oceanimonas baumannii TaxID=129578 RepID=A0A235CM39_9GAMM|nr:SulP family inorganic anion transporter [Oceanimonas baumannii]OYD25610.1 sodium-independent anion transporter [Oceanimonas baumannii]TDW61178.1 SulP family sulfate permease [Oceanimonas baumannii]